MGLLLRASSSLACRGDGRSRAVFCSVAFCVALASVAAVHGTGRSFLARRLVRGGDSVGYTYFRVGSPVDAVAATRAGFVLEGGGTDIDESFRWMIDRSGGGDFLVIRTDGGDAYNDYVYDMTSPGGQRAASVATLIVTSRAASSDPFVRRTIRSAEALWIAGGDQARHVAHWRGTPVADAIHDLVARGVPLGGTSSGLAVMGDLIYTSEADVPHEPHLSSTQALSDPHSFRMTLRRGFLHLPFLGGVILEPHFLQESRYGRMAAFLARAATEHPGGEPRGIGIDRCTALLVEPDGAARVITRPDHRFGKVVLFRMTTPPSVCEPGRPLSAEGLEALELGEGARLDLTRWSAIAEAGYVFRYSVHEGSPTVNPLAR